MMKALPLVAAIAAGTCTFCLVLLAAGRVAGLFCHRQKIDLGDALRDSTLCLLLLVLASAVFSAVTSLLALPACLAVSWVLSRRVPALVEKREREELRSACDGQLDVLCDIVAMGVRAGLSFDAALDVYCEKFDGELSREMQRARTAWKNGMVSRERALRDLARRLDSAALRRFSDTVVQAIRYGSPVADMLSVFADDLRKERYERIERQVAKAPVKMLIPTAVCILPGMLILVMGPVLLQFMESGI